MTENPQDIVDRELREFKRYSGDGQPNEPVGAPLPVGDPQSGVHNPKKVNLRNALKAPLEGWTEQADRARDEADRSASEADRSETARAGAEAACDIAAGYASDAVSQGNVPIYSTVIGMSAIEVPTGVLVVRENGYYSAGDGGGGVYRRVEAEPGHTGKFSTLDGAWWELERGQRPTPRNFGAKGDYDTDDTMAVRRWLAYYEITGDALGDRGGVYRCTDNIFLPEDVKIFGAGAPIIAAFPQSGSEKRLLRPGHKHLISGTVFIFSGSPENEYLTSRLDKFGVNRPCFIYDHAGPAILKDIAIIQDMDVLNAAGFLTSSMADNRSAEYTSALLVRSSMALFENVVIFGYFQNNGLVIVNKISENNPDYNRISGCTITGGLAIIGYDTNAVTTGNTGTLAYGSVIQGPDHHTRADTDPTIPCLFIDGKLTFTHEIRGHSFSSCSFRTLVDEAIKLDHCDDIQFAACVTEFSTVAGVPGLSQSGRLVGTANTMDIRIFGLAATGDIGVYDFIKAISGAYVIHGCGSSNRVLIGNGGAGVGAAGGTAIHSASGHSTIQLAKDLTSTNSGWLISRREGADDILEFRYNNTIMFSVSKDGAAKVRSFTVANAPPATVGSFAYFSNGDGGSPCFAVYSGGQWRRISLGAVISS